MRLILILFALLVGFGSSHSLASQGPLPPPADFGNWIMYFGNKKFNDKWNLHHEIQYRNYNMFGDLEQLLIRTGVGYNLTPNNNNVLLGYGFVNTNTYDGFYYNTVLEHRIFQQFISNQRVNRMYIQHRYRVEERWVEEDFKMRFRYFIALKMPLNNKVLTDKTAYLSAYSETFLSTSGDRFDRNRVYGGLGFKFNKHIRTEVGLMSQLYSNRHRNQLNIFVFGSY